MVPCFLRSESFDAEDFRRKLSSHTDNIHKKPKAILVAALVEIKYLQKGSRPFYSVVEIVLEC